MSDHSEESQTWIDLIATLFDRAWVAFLTGQARQRPRIEEFLMRGAKPRRSQLFEELLQVELEYRRKAGQEPTAEEYVQRFQDDGALINELLAAMDPIQSQPALTTAEQRENRQRAVGCSTVDHSPDGPPVAREVIDRVPTDAAIAEVGTSRQFVGPYELLEEIGRGGEGIVYRAREQGIVPVEVAIKLILAGTIHSRSEAQRFINEVRAMAGIYHDHIVPYLSSGEDRGQLYYVMRYMRGSNLDRYLTERREPLDPIDAARFMMQIADAVCYLHSQVPPIVHCDLKPRNILLDEAGKLYVADFGLAVLLEGEVGDGRGGPCGTIPYIAPEQYDGRFGNVGTSTDIYSLGVILYELITGQPPFPRNRESILRTLDTDPLPPSHLRAGVPDDLERICMKCLRKASRDRYASSSALLAELNRFVKDEPLPETPPHTAWQGVRDWARSEPALAARLAVIVACSAIMWGFRLFVGRYAPLLPDHWAARLEDSGFFRGHGPVEAILVWLNTAILASWGLASWAFQRQLNRRRQDGGLQLGWRVVDVFALCLLIELDDALMSPLTVAFAVLIVASAFWARADQILQTTLLSMAGYTILALSFRLNHTELDRPYRHLHYLVGLALLGLMLTHQANRTRALARICGARNRA